LDGGFRPCERKKINPPPARKLFRVVSALPRMNCAAQLCFFVFGKTFALGSELKKDLSGRKRSVAGCGLPFTKRFVAK